MPRKRVFAGKLIAIEDSTIRYKRARLTIKSSEYVLDKPVVTALNNWRDGRANQEEVALAFLRSRVVSHTPSFRWPNTGADIEALLPRVVRRGWELRIKKVSTVAELVLKLDELEREERATRNEQNTRLRAMIGESTNPEFPIKNLEQLANSLPRNVKPGWLFYQADAKTMVGQTEPPLPRAFEINPKNYRTVLDVLGDGGTTERLERLGMEVTFTHSGWGSLVSNFIRIAEASESQGAARVIEATARAVRGADHLDLTSALAQLQPMFRDLEDAIRESAGSPAQMVLLSVAGCLITILIQILLAKFGIWLIPPEPPLP